MTQTVDFPTAARAALLPALRELLDEERRIVRREEHLDPAYAVTHQALAGLLQRLITKLEAPRAAEPD